MVKAIQASLFDGHDAGRLNNSDQKKLGAGVLLANPAAGRRRVQSPVKIGNRKSTPEHAGAGGNKNNAQYGLATRKLAGPGNPQDHWSADGRIFYHYGIGYKTLPRGGISILGPEENIRDAPQPPPQPKKPCPKNKTRGKA